MRDLILTELAPVRPSARATPLNPVALPARPAPTPLAVHAVPGVARQIVADPARRNAESPATSDAEVRPLCLNAREIEFLGSALKGLTEREREVVIAICGGGTNEELAERMCIAVPTVRTHLMRLNQKFGTTSKGDVIRYVMAALLCGYRSGVISPLSEPDSSVR